MHFSMAERIQRFLDRFESRLALWASLGGPTVFGLISGWLSSGVAWIDHYGAFGWFVAFLFGTLVAGLILLTLVLVRYALVALSSRTRWAKETENINPLADELKKTRFKVIDLMNPFTRLISQKRVYDCELVGPANLFLYKNCSFFGVRFYDCVGVVLRPDNNGSVYTGGAAIIKDFEMHRGAIFGVTILVPPHGAAQLAQLGLPFVTYTGIPEIDNAPIHRQSRRAHGDASPEQQDIGAVDT